jgi:hypothetical protein
LVFGATPNLVEVVKDEAPAAVNPRLPVLNDIKESSLRVDYFERDNL